MIDLNNHTCFSGLYRAAIAQSGSTLIGWSYHREYKQSALDLARKVNKSASTSADILKTLQNAPANALKLSSDELLTSYAVSRTFKIRMSLVQYKFYHGLFMYRGCPHLMSI